MAKEISLQILRVQHSTAGGTLGGVLRTIVLRRVLELGIRRVTTNFHNRRGHCLLFVKNAQHLLALLYSRINEQHLNKVSGEKVLAVAFSEYCVLLTPLCYGIRGKKQEPIKL